MVFPNLPNPHPRSYQNNYQNRTTKQFVAVVAFHQSPNNTQNLEICLYPVFG